MVQKLLAAVLYLLALTAFGADPSFAASANKEFGKAWQARYESYLARRVEVDGRAKATSTIAVQSIRSGGASAATDLDAALEAAGEAAKLIGRGRLLYEFLEHFKTKPSPQLSQMWMQGKADELQGKAKDIDALDARVRATVRGTGDEQDRWLGELERLVMLRGTVEGMTLEVGLLDQNLRSYFSAIGQEQAADERRRAAFAAFGAALTQQSQQMRGWSARCVRSGNVTNCEGN